MELPAALRHAVDQALEGIALGELAAAAARLSQRYRAETRDGRLHLGDEMAALAYLTTRLPATYAAIRAALSMVTARLDAIAPAFVPRRQLDLGAGPGTAFWAALDCWPQLRSAHLLEGSSAIRRQGALLLARALPAGPASGPAEASENGITVADISWSDVDLASIGAGTRHDGGTHDGGGNQDADERRGDGPSADLVTLCYVLDELAPEARQRLINWAWARCDGLLLVVEPGTPAGWHRILTVRQHLLAAGARIVAPCPHDLACPLLPVQRAAVAGDIGTEDAGTGGVPGVAGSWCHFSRRVARSRLHRLAKQADVPWEDEKFIFIAMARPAILRAGATQPAAARLIAPPRGASGRLQMQLCEPDGQQRDRLISKRDGDLYRRARRLGWGDSLALAPEA